MDSNKIKMKKRLTYNFFDGENLYTDLQDTFFNPVNGSFNIFSKAYIEVNGVHHSLWKGGSKTLSTYKNFTKEQLDTIAKDYNLQVSLSDNGKLPDEYYIYI